MIGYNFRFSRVVVLLHERIRSGELGRYSLFTDAFNGLRGNTQAVGDRILAMAATPCSTWPRITSIF